MRKLLVSPELNVALFTFLLHYPWEFLQVPLYEQMPDLLHWDGVIICTRATLGDVIISLAAYWTVAAIWHDRRWIKRQGTATIIAFMAMGIMVTVAMEWHATAIANRWQYGDVMPTVPLLGTGLSPLLQWIFLPPLTIWFARRQILGQERLSNYRSVDKTT